LDDNEEERDADRGVDDPWEEGEDGIAIRTDTLTIEGELELSSVIETFVESERESVPLSADEAEVGFKNILARVSKEGEVTVEISAVRLFSSSSPLGAEGFVGVGTGMKTGGERLVRLGVEPEQGTEVRGSA
jgi:hypothetical protein